VTDTQTLGASDTDWMAERRRKAAHALPGLEMPSERDEIWRYLDLSFDPGFASAATSAGPAAEPDDIVEGWQGTVVSIVDGFVVTDGVASELQSSGPAVADRDTDLFATAFAALAPGTAVIDGGMLDVPVLVDVQATGIETTFPGLHVDVPGGGTGTVIVRYRSATAQPSTVVPTITVNVGDNARLALTVVQDWNYQTRAIGRAIATLGRDASLVLSEIGLGAHLGRLHLDVDFVGNGSNAKIYGAYFGEEDQTLDYRYFMNHIGTNTRCDMFLKGAVEDEALSVFTGMIRIEESGQKTESFQTNKHLILSDGAAAQSVPNLEILANDVKCGHGSSVGPLDQDQKYYLMSRGLTSDRADRLQVHGFFEEVVGQLPDPAVAAWVRDRINHKFIAAQEEGRV
jgi:Fe-S cluster assembly protein SufD